MIRANAQKIRKSKVLVFGLLLVAFMAMSMFSARFAHAVSFTVNSTADTGDTTPDGTCDSDPGAGTVCTLREAIQEASANNNAPTVDVINFAIPGAGPHTIHPNPELPDIDDPLTIDGYTEALGEGATPATPNTLASGSNAVLKIEIKGDLAPLGSDGFDIEAGPTTIRGLVINGFKEDGVGNSGQAIGVFNLAVNTNNVVEGNFIGTNVAGTAAAPNEGDGVIINGPLSTGNTIGGATPDKRNLIAGNGEQGVEISASDSNTVQGNLIGTQKNGTSDLGNEQDGVRMTSSSNNLVSDNIVAFNGDPTHPDNGVEVLKSGTTTPVGNRILSNSIFSNQVLGIDLSNGGSGGREQDVKDPDTGPNNLQNFPTVNSAFNSGVATAIGGTLNSTPNQSFTVQFFSSPNTANPSANFEGKSFLGEVNVTTDNNGNASFTANSPLITAGQLVTTTATSSSGDTSEFSDPRTVTTNPPPVADNDSFTFDQDTPLNVPAPGVLEGDTDNNTPGVASPRPVSGPSHGTLTLNSDGSFIYTPNGGFSGTDSFTYRATDGTSESNTATVTITVEDTTAPSAPVINSPPHNSFDTDGTIILSGTAEAGSTVNVFEGATLRGTTTAGSTGVWSLGLTGVANGPHSYTATATDQSGNASGSSAPRTITVDKVKPTVLPAVVPANGAVNVAPTTNVIATFSEKMKATTINRSTVRLVRNGTATPVPAVVTYNAATKKATLNPNANLVRGARYTVTITRGAQDLAGNPLAVAKVWSFTVKR
jgi:CSLREA domain-containing protein